VAGIEPATTPRLRRSNRSLHHRPNQFKKFAGEPTRRGLGARSPLGVSPRGLRLAPSSSDPRRRPCFPARLQLGEVSLLFHHRRSLL